MIGIVIVAHGNLSQDFITVAENVIGQRVKQIEAISIEPADSSEKILDDMRSAINRVDSGSGVMILTDFFGGTPTNLGLAFREEKVAVVWGLNFSMLSSLINNREKHKLEELIKIICDGARRGIGGVAGAEDLVNHNS